MEPGQSPGFWDHGGLLPENAPREKDILDASTTVNPFGPPFSLEDLLAGIGKGWTSYPDPWSASLSSRIARRMGLPADCLVPGPGATALIYRWMETVRPRRLVLFEPIFSEYPRAAGVYGIPVLRVPGGVPLVFAGGRPESAGEWGVDFGRFEPQAGDWVVLVNPVNPTGQAFSMRQAQEFFVRLARAGAGLLLDESFQDFLENRDSLLGSIAPDNPFLSVVRSVTKVTGLPGIRTGWLASSRETVQKIRQSLGPWALGVLECGVMDRYYALPDWNFDRIRQARDRLFAFFVSVGLPVAEGFSPYLFVHTSWGRKAPEWRDRFFRERGVFVRIAEGFGPRSGSDYVRLGHQAFEKPSVIEELFSENRGSF